VKRQTRLILDTLLLGVVGALSAQLFTWMLHIAASVFLVHIAGYQPPGLPEEGGVLMQVIGSHGLWLVPIVTTLGGLISGIIVFSLAPEAEGHGTDTAVKAFHQAGGFIRARVPPIKMLASAITIGSGGAAGREGPIALISAGVGSLYATITDRPDEERRLLLLVGAAAGLSAIFRSPIGTAFFVIEVLYSGMEFDVSALLFTMLGSVTAYAVNGLFVGFQPLFIVPPGVAQPEAADYLWFAGLGIASGIVATLLPIAFYGIRDAFHKIPIPPHFKPAIGGLGVGILALGLPQILGGGYGWIQEAIDGRLALGLLVALVFAKILALALTISSGGSGGVFAPSLFIGAMLGGVMAQIFHQPPAPFVIVGMGAVFAGAARVPVATLLMVTEMTGGYDLLVAAGLAVMLSYLIEVNLSARFKYISLYEAQVPGRPDSPAHQVEQVEAAIRLLADENVSVPKTVSHLDLRTLLASGIPVDLPDNKNMLIGVLKQDSPFAKNKIGTTPLHVDHNGIEIVAIFRDGHTLLPRPEVVLEPGDKLLLITSPQDWHEQQVNFDPLTFPAMRKLKV
jgi:CIC family chloride channel protein